MSTRYQNLNYFLIDDFREVKISEVAQFVLKNKQEKQVMQLVLDNDKLLSSRALWLLQHCAQLNFERIIPFHEKLLLNLKSKNLHDGVIRNTLRMFQNYPIPKKHESFLLDLCFGYLQNPQMAIAIRVFSMSVIFNISKPFPELVNELKLILTHIIETEDGPAILSRAKKVLAQIKKLH